MGSSTAASCGVVRWFERLITEAVNESDARAENGNEADARDEYVGEEEHGEKEGFGNDGRGKRGRGGSSGDRGRSGGSGGVAAVDEDDSGSEDEADAHNGRNGPLPSKGRPARAVREAYRRDRCVRQLLAPVKRALEAAVSCPPPAPSPPSHAHSEPPTTSACSFTPAAPARSTEGSTNIPTDGAFEHGLENAFAMGVLVLEAWRRVALASEARSYGSMSAEGLGRSWERLLRRLRVVLVVSHRCRRHAHAHAVEVSAGGASASGASAEGGGGAPFEAASASVRRAYLSTGLFDSVIMARSLSVASISTGKLSFRQVLALDYIILTGSLDSGGSGGSGSSSSGGGGDIACS